MKKLTDIFAEIETLKAPAWIATNQGTYGAEEACRKCGSGDPQFANREVYENLDGTQYATGPDEEDAPGYMHPRSHIPAHVRREKIAALEAQIPKANAAEQKEADTAITMARKRVAAQALRVDVAEILSVSGRMDGPEIIVHLRDAHHMDGKIVKLTRK